MRAAVVASLLAGSALVSPSAFALTEPTPTVASEPRVRHVEYVQDAIVKIAVPVGSEVQLILSPDETSKVGVSVAQKAWHHARFRNTIVFAPEDSATTTFAHIVSPLPNGTTRPYTIELTPVGRSATAPAVQIASAGSVNALPAPDYYATVRFTYEQADKQAKAEAATQAKHAAVAEARARRVAMVQSGPPVVHMKGAAETQRRCDFLWRGSAALLPQAACNRGVTTSFLWAGQTPVPAIFTVTPDGREQAVTQAADPTHPGLIVVPQTAQRWVLRSGPKLVAELYDAAFDPLAGESVPGADSPMVHWQQQQRGVRGWQRASLR